MFCSRRRRSETSGRAKLPLYLVGLLFGLQVATCEPSQQQQQRAGSNELSQDSFAMAAPEALASFGSYARGAGYVNSKRARKMSAFMPMRGRKDGRDAFRRQQLDALHAELPSLAALGRELEPTGELSVLRLMGRPLVGELDGRPAVPRQFMEQLEQMARQQRPPTAGSGYSALFQPPVGPIETVETKYRRAFHPMRGKKSDPQMGAGDDADEAESEAAGQGFMQDAGPRGLFDSAA